ncbi:ABC transporter permease [Paenibacillus arenilitoris]|uniref:ABC transporter permease n=1 Tax=Paenibacillus arenilitoris TaxID=2772299 RepID=A0A927CRJ0_9BACL|nr:ABC transporter permease [Paenibacillus arenilitoris]MBD2872439.1 ABC transporter permease [Paenibacillus arenilitoris]
MMLKALSADLLKIRGKGIWFLVALGPVGVIAMQALNYGLRYDYLTKQYAGRLWETLLDNILMFVPIALYLGVTLVSSLLANVEHGTNAWKQLLALPISRNAVFGAKFALSVLLLAVSCCLLAVGTIALGLLLKFGTDIPYLAILRLSFLPFLASFPALALMLWLCMTMKNQALPVTLGVMAGVVSVFSPNLSEWFPLNWPIFGYEGPRQELFAGAGLLCGALILLVGAIHFNKKDVD